MSALFISPTTDVIEAGNPDSIGRIRVYDGYGTYYAEITASALSANAGWVVPDFNSQSFVGTTAQQTLTAKRIVPRIVTTTDDATAVIDCTVTDIYELTAMANATTFSVTGSPSNGETLLVRLKDNGTARALTWGSEFASKGATLPTTTVLGKQHYVGFVYNSASSKWECIMATVEA